MKGAPRSASGVASCLFKTPKSAKGKVLAGTVSFSAGGTAFAKRFVAKLAAERIDDRGQRLACRRRRSSGAARSSSAVGPRLTIANACASSGSPATGHTSSDEPTTSMSEAARASSSPAPSRLRAAARRRRRRRASGPRRTAGRAGPGRRGAARATASSGSVHRQRGTARTGSTRAPRRRRGSRRARGAVSMFCVTTAWTSPRARARRARGVRRSARPRAAARSAAR